MPNTSAPIRVHRAPVPTLWAAVVAERLGHPTDTALRLAAALAGTAARAKARRLGIAEKRDAGKDAKPAAKRDTVRLLGRDVPLAHDADGVVLAGAGEGRPSPAAPMAAYVAKASGARLDEVGAAMEALAGRLEPEELNRVGFRLYGAFRREVPADVKGWGAKGALYLGKIAAAAG